MSKEQNSLDRAVKALAESTIPKGPSENLIRKTLEQIEKEQTTIPFKERIIKMKSISKFAAAAIIIIGVSVLFLFNSNPGSIALADVYARVQQAQAFMYKMSMTMNGSMVEGMPVKKTGSEAIAIVSVEYGMKIETTIDLPEQGMTMVQQMYMNPTQKSMTMVLPDEKKYIRMEYNEESLERTKKESGEPREMIKKMLSCEYTDLGISEIDGVRVQGFETKDPAYISMTYDEECKATLWVDVQTWLPVYSEMNFIVGDNAKMHCVMHDFQWGIPVQPDDFKPAITDDYEELANVKMPETNEENAFEGFKKHVELTGHYPKSLDGMKLVMDAMKAIEALPEMQELKKNKKQNAKQAINRMMQELLPIQSIGSFYAMLVQEKKDPKYYGDQVMPTDTDAVLMRWKVEGDTYKVVFGDLTVAEMPYQELRQIEPQPLQQEEAATP